MENTTKALMIAAEVLIGILILTLAVYLVNIFGKNAEEQEKAIYRKNLTQFNNEFTKFETPSQTISLANCKDANGFEIIEKTNQYITSLDVVTVVNLARQFNKDFTNNDKNSISYINVKVGGINMTQLVDASWENEKSNLFENATIPNEVIYRRYTCKITLSQETGRVKDIVINSMF